MSPPLKPRSLNVLIIGANGYLGQAIGRAFLRTPTPAPSAFRVHGLVRSPSAAQYIAKDEILPIVGSLASRDSLLQQICSYAQTWDVIVTATEPPFTDSMEAKQRHWGDVLGLVEGLADVSEGNGVRPFVLWSSGCKDYGRTGVDGEGGLKPHTEESEVVVHEVVQSRTEAALRVLEVSKGEGAKFDVAVVRATPVFGYSGSYFGAGFDYVEALYAAEGARVGGGKRVLKFMGHPGTILHAVHVDDCAEGYVALATTALFGGGGGRGEVSGEVFNISGRRYETLRETAAALAEEYGFDEVEYEVEADQLPDGVSPLTSQLVFGWSQWVGSEKIRKATGWSDWRPLLGENLHVYRLAYEAVSGDEWMIMYRE